jgi:hypothetical protein
MLELLLFDNAARSSRLRLHVAAGASVRTTSYIPGANSAIEASKSAMEFGVGTMTSALPLATGTGRRTSLESALESVGE